GRLTNRLGNYSDYLRSRQSALHPIQNLRTTPPPPPASKPSPEFQRERQMGDGQRRKSIDRLERDISRLEGKLNRIGDELLIAEVDQDYDAMARLSAEHQETEDALDAAYAEWEEIQSAAEQVVAR
ncbi:MAG: ABC transporter C-terminal domain-containing protein, partial [Thermomicrobiales bacterium]